MVHMKVRWYTRTGMSRTKRPFFFGFPSATETTGLIDIKELARYLEDGVHARNYGYITEGLELGRNQSSGISSSISGRGGGWS